MNKNNKSLSELNELPCFSSIKPADIESALNQLLQENRNRLNALLENNQQPSWEETLQPIEDMSDLLNLFWSPINHLHSVADNNELRQAYHACLPKLTDYFTELGQNKSLYLVYKRVAESKAFLIFDDARKKLIENALREFRLAGVDLSKNKQLRLKCVKKRLSELQTKFEENLLDATHAWSKHISSEDELAGLPASSLALAAQMAKEQGKKGWLLSLDFPCYMAAMKYADNVALREEMYIAYVTRASDQVQCTDHRKWDNSEIINEILALRYEQAQLLGYKNYANYSLVRKMADNSDQVLDFLNDLVARSRKMAEQELKTLQDFTSSKFGIQKLPHWDINYYKEKLRQEKYQLSQEELRPYFPIHQVLEGLFTIVQRLYDIVIKRRTGVDAWHEDVCFFDILDKDGLLRGGFYLDPYIRMGKRDGAWMDECVCRKRTVSGIRLPVAYLTCNFAPPTDNVPALLTHNDVITLFHEFGHGLHHMLTLVDYPAISGINGVPWDAIELPSQFMENWCWQREALDLIGRHYQTGEPISDDIFGRITASRNFHTGMQMLRQLEFSLFDFNLHQQAVSESSVDVQSLLDETRQQIAVVRLPHYNRFQHSFSHIFAGGYAAGYYSYKWAEMLSADAFSRFEDEGIFNQDAGRSFLHCILEQGGVKSPVDLFINFRGREPNIDALLRQQGIAC